MLTHTVNFGKRKSSTHHHLDHRQMEVTWLASSMATSYLIVSTCIVPIPWWSVRFHPWFTVARWAAKTLIFFVQTYPLLLRVLRVCLLVCCARTIQQTSYRNLSSRHQCYEELVPSAWTPFGTSPASVQLLTCCPSPSCPFQLVLKPLAASKKETRPSCPNPLAITLRRTTLYTGSGILHILLSNFSVNAPETIPSNAFLTAANLSATHNALSSQFWRNPFFHWKSMVVLQGEPLPPFGAGKA